MCKVSIKKKNSYGALNWYAVEYSDEGSNKLTLNLSLHFNLGNLGINFRKAVWTKGRDYRSTGF